ncbi:MAG TPA: biotin-dependent carboxyltransferase family protein [Bacilli bacterium]|nr:biotin-dependent carboxyltransferase family protein [Bacilli bacterium]
MTLHVLKPGLLTTVQDLGRHGYQKDGVVVGGAMDAHALRLANLLVGNAEQAAGLEMTLVGATLRFDQAALIALGGGDLTPTVNGQPVPLWRPVYLPADSVLELKAARTGCRAYLAIAGGLDLPPVLGSRSTYLRGGFGGLEGRALQEGDTLQSSTPSPTAQEQMQRLQARLAKEDLPFATPAWSVSQDLLPAYSSHPIIRVMRGSEFDKFTSASHEHFFQTAFRVTPQSDRMGYRLDGGTKQPALQLREPLELISEAVTMGTIQVPAGGDPILLMADRQTTGGYPKIAQVARVDLPLLAQVMPGADVRFVEVSVAKAQELLLRREADVARFKQGLRLNSHADRSSSQRSEATCIA